jgi:hypothetical protein
MVPLVSGKQPVEFALGLRIDAGSDARARNGGETKFAREPQHAVGRPLRHLHQRVYTRVTDRALDQGLAKRFARFQEAI